MALNLDGFVTKEQEWGGLYKAADTLERNRYHQQVLDERREGKRAATGKFLENYLDPKEHLSGSPYDPKIATDLTDILAEGASLADKGADANMIMMALAPKVKGVVEYSEKAKLIKQQHDKAVEMVKSIKGIDPKKYSDAFKDMAFYDTDPKTEEKKLRETSAIDPNKFYGDEVLQNGDVFTNEGIGDFVKTAGKETRNSDYRYYNKLGSLNRTKAAYTSPAFMQPEEDSRGAFKEFVPQYDVATDAGLPKELDFHTENGTQKAPVRMVTDGVFNSLPPSAKGYLRQEARKYAKEHGVELSSPQAYNFAKAIAYDELKESGKLSSSVSELVDNKPSTFQIKVDNGIPFYRPSSGGSGGESNVNDLYGRIKGKVDTNAGKGFGTRFTALDADEKQVIKNFLGNSSLPDEEIFLKATDDGRVGVYKTSDGGKTIANDRTIITTLPKVGTNLKVQPGVAEKRAVAKQGEPQVKQSSSKMVTMVLNGKEGQIPEGKVAEFLKKYPNAKRK
jgi:hypothetical protein